MKILITGGNGNIAKMIKNNLSEFFYMYSGLTKVVTG